jgi:multiple sugar transport system ATP-binding protein
MSMADRIMVMREGQGAQLGTPNEIYFRPANQFVAGFIGTPPMNMLEVELEEEDGKAWLVSPHFRIPLEGEAAQALQNSGVRQAVLGVRPEDVTVSLEGGDFSAQVFVVEPQGPQQILSFKLDETLIIKSLTSADISVSPGQKVWLSFNRERLHLFHRDTGDRLN